MSETQQTQTGYIQIPAGEGASSLERLLAANLGREVVAEFVVGTDEIVRKSGMLYAVSAEYLVLFDDVNLNNIVCYLPSLRFVTFYLPGTRPDVNERMTDLRQSGQADGDVRGAASTPNPTRVQTQAALNYTKRKARKLD